MMANCSHLPRLLIFFALLALAAGNDDGPAAATAAARPGCPTRCGAVDIPYPFGIGEQCAIHKSFALSCNSSTGGGSAMTPFIEDLPVTRVSVPEHKVWIKSWISSRCHYPDGKVAPYNTPSVNVTRSPYWFSDTDNKVFVIGCNTVGNVRVVAYPQGVSTTIGCYTTCHKAIKNGTCSGGGCCQADVPKNMTYYQAYFNNYYNDTTDRTTPCSYTVMMEKEAFSFSTAYLTSTVFNDTYKGMAPLVLEWHVGEQPCDVAKRNVSSYACLSRDSDCVSSPNPPGYRCRCLDGYKGNPYIHGGCTDINECLDNVTNPCMGICTNTLGGFKCSCPRGEQTIQGICVPDQKVAYWVMRAVGASIGFVALVAIVTGAYLIRERRKLQRIRQNYFRQHGGLLLFEEMKSQQGVAFKILSEEELQQATDKFDERHIVGHGGNGTVYRGVLRDGVEVAIKKCKTIDEKQKKEFGREMLILSQINHRNVVKLLGCCLEVEVPTLVYEFVPGGTLYELIHGSPDRHISLGARLQIAHDSAEALAYLHSWASPPILHGDVKSSNILLDGGYTAKVSDFGASILAPSDESQFVTLVQGTCGYLDPEYIQTCRLTDKSDVYSFGVVLLELLTRKKAYNLQAPEHEKTLSLMFLDAMKRRRLDEILDDQVKDDSNNSAEIVEEIAELAQQCLEMCGEERPSMKEVADKLGRLRRMLQHPWVDQSSPEETESLLGRLSYEANSGFVGSTGNFCVDKEAVMSLEFGR
ncbi:unnamed protein product [Urochloa decumbens]|uniref:Protein kinase domain-containing protein n=1 Tax=Urochloa decumbens TaxID=240449 RepID=A0ABC9EHB9_9POAL